MNKLIKAGHKNDDFAKNDGTVDNKGLISLLMNVQ